MIKGVYLYQKNGEISWKKTRFLLDRAFQKWIRRVSSTTELLNLYERAQKWYSSQQPLKNLLPNLPIRVPLQGIQFQDTIDLVDQEEIYEFVEGNFLQPHDFSRHLRAYAFQKQTGRRLRFYWFIDIQPKTILYKREPWPFYDRSIKQVENILAFTLSGLRHGYYPPLVGTRCLSCEARVQCIEEKDFFEIYLGG